MVDRPHERQQERFKRHVAGGGNRKRRPWKVRVLASDAEAPLRGDSGSLRGHSFGMTRSQQGGTGLSVEPASARRVSFKLFAA
jgi:hypothetical protein